MLIIKLRTNNDDKTLRKALEAYLKPNDVRRPLTSLKRVKKEQKHEKSMLFEYFGNYY